MATPTVLLASTDHSLASAIGEVVGPISPLALEVVAGVGPAAGELHREEVLLIIVHLVGDDGVEAVTRLLRSIAQARRLIATLVVSEGYRAAEALAMLQLGATDYLPRPLDLGRMAYLIDSLTLRARRLGHAAAQAPPSPPATAPVHILEDDRAFIYMPSNKMGRLMDQLQRVAPRDTTILLGGETGTGKSRLAGLIHRMSPRRSRPFLSINCGALSASLIESEMFGHVRGAFTGADTDRVGKFAEVGEGTLFLDEVDSLPLPVQAKLLRAVEERAFEPVGSNRTQQMRARLIAASNRPLDREVAEGRFRADLYHRLNVIAFSVPPLRERPGVVPHLARGFIEEFAIRAQLPVGEIEPRALQALEAYHWPGNIRELRNVIERAVALCPGHIIRLDDLPDHFQDLDRTMPVPEAAGSHAASATSLANFKEDAERAQIARALERNANNKLRAAAELGISRMTLYNKLRKYGLSFGA